MSHVLKNRNSSARAIRKIIVADATVLLITGRLAHTDVRLQKHAGMFCASRTSVWLNCYNKKCEEHKNG